MAGLIFDVFGGVAQLGERLLCKQEVIGSIPFTSTTVGKNQFTTALLFDNLYAIVCSRYKRFISAVVSAILWPSY
jgi:hypothetical protein